MDSQGIKNREGPVNDPRIVEAMLGHAQDDHDEMDILYLLHDAHHHFKLAIVCGRRVKIGRLWRFHIVAVARR